MFNFIAKQLADQAVLTALLATAAFLIVGFLGKCFAKAGMDWDAAFVGMEAALAALSGSAIYGLELARKMDESVKDGAKQKVLAAIASEQGSNQAFVIGAFVAYFLAVSLHLVWEKRSHQPFLRWLALFGAANFLGLATLAAFIIIFKRV